MPAAIDLIHFSTGFLPNPGDVIDYYVGVSNIGQFAIDSKTLQISSNLNLSYRSLTDVDPVSGLSFNIGDDDRDGIFDGGETWFYTAAYLVTAQDISSNGASDGVADGALTNRVVVTASDPTGPSSRVSSSSLALVEERPAITLSQTGSPNPARAGDQVNFELSVRNSGNVSFASLNLSGGPLGTPRAVTGAGGFNSGDLDGDGCFDVGETWRYITSYRVSQADLDNLGLIDGTADGALSNTVRAKALVFGEGSSSFVEATSSASNALESGQLPTRRISVVKTPVLPEGQSGVAANTPVVFNYTVSNTGSRPLSNINLVDDGATPTFAGDDFNPTYLSGDSNGNSVLDPGENWLYSATAIPPLVMTVKVTTVSNPIGSGTISYKYLANGDIRVFYRQDPNFNDTTYGTGSVGWTSRTHAFSNLTGSDKNGWLLKYADGTTMAQFYQDYLTASGTPSGAYSGYQSLGFGGGDGRWVGGAVSVTQAQTLLKDFDTTMEFNLNQGGSWKGMSYASMIVNSPTGANVLPGDPKPSWDEVNGYYFTIDKAAIATRGFGGAYIFDQHNSPAKSGSSNSYIPDITYADSVNIARVSGNDGSTTATASSSAT
ncbi:MAG: hypothetical protein VKK97_05645, partial [Synechococcaceae cyanobacterium]|nr:hypothetical protein [Synechococcaceae cyanobacterium]